MVAEGSEGAKSLSEGIVLLGYSKNKEQKETNDTNIPLREIIALPLSHCHPN